MMKFKLNKQKSIAIVATALSASLALSACQKQETIDVPYIPEIEVHTVTFKSGDEVYHIEVTPDITAGYTPAISPKEGYILEGWTLNGEPYDFSTPVTSDMTLVANWVPDRSREKLEEQNSAKETLINMLDSLNQYRLDYSFTDMKDSFVLSIYDYSSLKEVIAFLEENTALKDKLSIYLMFNQTSECPDLKKLTSIYQCSIFIMKDYSNVNITDNLTVSNIKDLVLAQNSRVSKQDLTLFASISGINISLYDTDNLINLVNCNSSASLGAISLDIFNDDSLENAEITLPKCDNLVLRNFGSLKNTVINCNSIHADITSSTSDFEVKGILGTISLRTDISDSGFRKSPLFGSLLSAMELRLINQDTEDDYLLVSKDNGSIEVYNMNIPDNREIGTFTQAEIIGVTSLER